jgi:hypothetical protein
MSQDRREKLFDRFTNDEVLTALLHLTDHLTSWMNQAGISAGSTANYDLYRATKKAVISEWERSTGKKLELEVEPNRQ